jgi:hypothetical protein
MPSFPYDSQLEFNSILWIEYLLGKRQGIKYSLKATIIHILSSYIGTTISRKLTEMQ